MQTNCLSPRPRDIAASLFKFVGGSERGQAWEIPQTRLGSIANKILAAYSPWMNSAQSANALVVRYEDVASEPRRAVQVLARDAGFEFSLDRIEHLTWLAADARHQASWITQLEGQKPSAESIGAFKRAAQ